MIVAGRIETTNTQTKSCYKSTLAYLWFRYGGGRTRRLLNHRTKKEYLWIVLHGSKNDDRKQRNAMAPGGRLNMARRWASILIRHTCNSSKSSKTFLHKTVRSLTRRVAQADICQSLSAKDTLSSGAINRRGCLPVPKS